VLAYVRRLATALTRRNPSGELWIPDGIELAFARLIEPSWPT
jgi:hypothetical protein